MVAVCPFIVEPSLLAAYPFGGKTLVSPFPGEFSNNFISCLLVLLIRRRCCLHRSKTLSAYSANIICLTFASTLPAEASRTTTALVRPTAPTDERAHFETWDGTHTKTGGVIAVELDNSIWAGATAVKVSVPLFSTFSCVRGAFKKVKFGYCVRNGVKLATLKFAEVDAVIAKIEPRRQDRGVQIYSSHTNRYDDSRETVIK